MKTLKDLKTHMLAKPAPATHAVDWVLLDQLLRQTVLQNGQAMEQST